MKGMLPAVFLTIPLLMPVPQSTAATRDIFADASSAVSRAFDARASTSLRTDPVIPPLYAREDRGLLLVLSPGSPCTAACLRLKVTF